MKTAETIAQHTEMAKSFKAQTSSKRIGRKRLNPKKYMPPPNSLKNLRPYVPGKSGNPGGKPGYDVAASLARAVIEGAQQAAYQGLAEQLAKGNAYTFKELADRGYGKLKERLEHTVTADLLRALDEGRKRAALR